MINRCKASYLDPLNVNSELEPIQSNIGIAGEARKKISAATLSLPTESIIHVER